MTAWVQDLIEQMGAFGIGLLMFLENLFPPIPSEVVLPLAGYRAAEGDLSLTLALVAGIAGSVLGVTIWYYAGRWLGIPRLKRFARSHGRMLTLTPKDIDRVDRWFDRHGGKAVLFGRLVPGVRTLISVPAGVSGMSTKRFLVLTTIGTSLWSSTLIVLGYFLGERFERAETLISPVGNIIIGGALLYYLYRVATFRRHVARAKPRQRDERELQKIGECPGTGGVDVDRR